MPDHGSSGHDPSSATVLRAGTEHLVERFGDRVDDVGAWARDLVVPVAARVAGLRRRDGRAPIVGLHGGQGSGKSTLAEGVAVLLADVFGAHVVAVSLDDLYLPHDDRVRLGATVHPLLATRGVPGTHDVDLGCATLDALATAGPGDVVSVPRFDKRADTRRPLPDTVRGPVDVVIFEGWCVGLPPPPDRDLVAPVNDLEHTRDPDGAWRRHVAAQLAGPYAALWSRLDLLVALIVPDMASVVRWRGGAEAQLGPSEGPDRGVTDVEAFVAHYERWTRWGVQAMPARADLTVWLDGAHRVVRVRAGGDQRAAATSSGMQKP